MTDRIQHARDWIAAQLQTEAAMTPGPWLEDTDSTELEPEIPVIMSPALGVPLFRIFGGATFADMPGAIAARNQWRALLLIADDLLAELAEMIGYCDAADDKPDGPTMFDEWATRIIARLREAGYTESK